MTNPMFSPQPNYSGVTIQIANPTVNTNPFIQPNEPNKNVGYVSCPQAYYYNPANVENSSEKNTKVQNTEIQNKEVKESGYSNAYPAQYYLNNYNYQGSGDFNPPKTNKDFADNNNIDDTVTNSNEQNSALKHYNVENGRKNDSDLSKSSSIIEDIDERDAQIKESKQNTKETKIVALTDEYIKSLENYLNNPNDEIRLMASKEILTRLDEDKDRYDDAALNALLNKMLQDPSKLVRIAALSAFGSQLACGNDYTIKLLQNIQNNPSADKEDVLQAADVLLKMSAGTEVKNIPTPPKETKQK